MASSTGGFLQVGSVQHESTEVDRNRQIQTEEERDRKREREIERKQRGDFEPDRNKCRDFSGESGAGVGSELFRRENWIFRKPKRWQFSPPFFTQMARKKKNERNGITSHRDRAENRSFKAAPASEKNLQACKLFVRRWIFLARP